MRFSCRCNHLFELPDSEAGGFVQCPRCGILNDVPLLSELPTLKEDGTYEIDAPPPREDPDRLRTLGYVFAKGSRDADGNSIDLRNTPEDIAAAGTSDGPMQAGIRAVGTRPRYDPETGELIVPLDVKPDPRDEAKQTSIPLAKPAISYATIHTVRPMGPGRQFAELFMPVNLLVMVLVVVVHLIAQSIVGLLFGAGIMIISPVLLLLQCAIIAHYGNIIDETGPAEGSELPRPLRDLRWHEDLWSPFVAAFGGVMLCYLSALVCLLYIAVGRSALLGTVGVAAITTAVIILGKLTISLAAIELNDVRWGEDVGLPLVACAAALAAIFGPATLLALVSAADLPAYAAAGALGLVGTWALPAVLITIGTSGSAVNLRPDRVLGTIRACGARYFISIFAWIIALPAYLWGLLYTSIAIQAVIFSGGVVGRLGVIKLVCIAVLPLLLGVYLMHFFCWELGTLYRGHHGQFPWLFQRHTPVNSSRSSAAIARAVAARKATLAQAAATPVVRSSRPR